MKKQMNPKLLSLAALLTMFILLSFQKTEVREYQVILNSKGKIAHAEAFANSGTTGAGKIKNGSADHRMNQDSKVRTGQAELEYWIRWKNQFVWTLPGKGSTLLPRTTGC